jgi:hypothetical protein
LENWCDRYTFPRGGVCIKIVINNNDDDDDDALFRTLATLVAASLIREPPSHMSSASLSSELDLSPSQVPASQRIAMLERDKLLSQRCVRHRHHGRVRRHFQLYLSTPQPTPKSTPTSTMNDNNIDVVVGIDDFRTPFHDARATGETTSSSQSDLVASLAFLTPRTSPTEFDQENVSLAATCILFPTQELQSRHGLDYRWSPSPDDDTISVLADEVTADNHIDEPELIRRRRPTTT